MWIKICGLTTKEAVDAAVAEKVNAVGFVFANSKRQVRTAQARELARDVPNTIARVAVLLHPSQAEIDAICAEFIPDMLQTDYEDLSQLHIPPAVQALPVLRSGKSIPTTLPARLLYEGAQSGTGATADWRQAAQIAARTQLILAGGLGSSNVADAIVRVRPFGVDVSSGVESAPGTKDVNKIVEFVAAARRAAQVMRERR